MFTIGYYDDSHGAGGTTRYLEELLSALDRGRFRPVVFSPQPAPWHDTMRALGAEVVTGPVLQVAPRAPVQHHVELPPLRPQPLPAVSFFTRARTTAAWHLGQRRELGALEGLFRRHRVDLLHTNNVGAEPAPIAARRAGVPRLLGTLHVDPSYDLVGAERARRFLRLQQRSMAALDRAIAVSADTALAWRTHLGLRDTDRPPMVVIPNGIRLDRLTRRRPIAEAKRALGLEPEDLVLGSLGRLDYAKGYADLIEALPTILANVPRARFVHAGRGPLAEALSLEASRLGIEQRVLWLGFRSDVRDLLEATDVYVQPSWCETQGLGVLEAGALGIAAVTTTAGGLPETVGDSSGWTVPPRAPEALAATITAVLGNPADRERMGLRFQARVRAQFSHDRMVADTMLQYDALLTQDPR